MSEQTDSPGKFQGVWGAAAPIRRASVPWVDPTAWDGFLDWEARDKACSGNEAVPGATSDVEGNFGQPRDKKNGDDRWCCVCVCKEKSKPGGFM